MPGVEKRLIASARRRVLPNDGFSWIDRRLVRDGFLAGLTGQEALLYFFLVAVADQDGLSFYGTHKTAALLKLTEQGVEAARRGLERKELVLYRAPLYQVLSLPDAPAHHTVADIGASRPARNTDGPTTIGDILRTALGPLTPPAGGCAPPCAPESRGS
jgi:hypothetical protein